MIGPRLTRRRLALLAVVALLLGGTALLSSGVSWHPVSSAVLGDQWQCSSLAFLTTCSRVETTVPVAHGASRILHGRPGA
jgi:hypothetical protein